jgi:hypothetical protein
MIRLFSAFALVGLGTFLFQIAGQHPEKAWQAYLVNFLLWSAVAQGGFLFSVVLHITKARWGKPLQSVAESFAAFFPLSFLLFLLLFLGKEHVFPWLNGDVHGRADWLNLPFLFGRDTAGLAILYGLGLAYLYNALRLKRSNPETSVGETSLPQTRSVPDLKQLELYQKRTNVFAVLYIMAFAFVLTLVAFDLVMSMQPLWVSTLFGAYVFVKAFYIGLAALIILANLIYISRGSASGLTPSQFHDAGKLFFAFGLLWADFFYCQLLVIWYGNITEETSYIIQRAMISPWNTLAWTVFILSFVIPFLILLNKSVKTKPRFMIGLCSLVFVGIWLEHYLLLGPALNPNAHSIPISIADVLITLGFLALMAMAVRFALARFPELIPVKQREVK